MAKTRFPQTETQPFLDHLLPICTASISTTRSPPIRFTFFPMVIGVRRVTRL
jgi:hypothetical protein